MSKKFAIIGGDLRIIKLAEMLEQEGNTIKTYGLEKAEELKTKPNIIFCKTIKEAIENSEIVIGPIPFSNNKKDINTPYSEKTITIAELLNTIKNQTLIVGSYNQEKNKNIKIIDIMEREELAILNAIATAEGAIEIAISNTNKIIQGSKTLILGFGRIGKVLAKKMEGLSANITCAARKDEDLAWIKTYGYKSTNINELGRNLSEYDIIINTVPHLILTQERLEHVHKDCLIIDLASKPGGIDQEAIKKRKLKFIWALALPGKIAPVTTAQFIKETINNIIYKRKEEIK